MSEIQVDFEIPVAFTVKNGYLKVVEDLDCGESSFIAKCVTINTEGVYVDIPYENVKSLIPEDMKGSVDICGGRVGIWIDVSEIEFTPGFDICEPY